MKYIMPDESFEVAERKTEARDLIAECLGGFPSGGRCKGLFKNRFSGNQAHVNTNYV